METSDRDWRGIAAVLSAPGALDRLADGITPAVSAAADLLTAVTACARALDAFADAAQTIRSRAASLSGEIDDLHREGAVQPEGAALNLVGHSYGTTTAGYALSQGSTEVDTFVSLASAGMPSDVHSAADLHAGHIYAIQARDVLLLDAPGSGDRFADLGRALSGRDDPTAPGFGATVLGADGMPDPNADPTADRPVGHHDIDSIGSVRGYLSQGTESLHNTSLALVRGGRGATTARNTQLTPLEQALSHEDADGDPVPWSPY